MSIERIKNYIIENAKKEAAQLIKTAEEQFRNETESAKLSLWKKYQEILSIMFIGTAIFVVGGALIVLRKQ